MGKITVWKKVVKKKVEDGHIYLKYEFNHIQDGWVDGDYPQPFKDEYVNQVNWKNDSWVKEFKYLVDGKIVNYI